MLKRVTAVLVCLLIVVPLFGQLSDSEILLWAAPQVSVPIGESRGDFAFGGGGSFGSAIPLGVIPKTSLSAFVDYSFAPIVGNLGSLSLLSGGLGIRYSQPIGDSLFVSAGVHGGYYFAALNEPGGSSGTNPFVGAAIGASVRLWPRLGLDAELSYGGYLGLSHEFIIRVGSHFAIPVRQQGSGLIRMDDERLQNLLSEEPRQSGEMQLSEVELEPVFPVLFTYYTDHPLGALSLTNAGEEPASNVRVSLFVRQYMDDEVLCARIDQIAPDETVTVALNALFNDSVLNVSEGTQVLGRVSLEYEQYGAGHTQTITEPLRLYDRNAITWDDDRKVAAFVTAKDSHVRTFARNVVAMTPKNDTLSSNLLRGLAVFEALGSYGIGYVPDPTTPYADLSSTTDTIDFLQFPSQTLDLRSGDCDDLSTLYAALLESIGIESAFVTVPGHIYAAFSLDQSVPEAARYLYHTDELIDINGVAWLPVEVTALDQGFTIAWQRGADFYRRYLENDEVGFFPVREAWLDYEPVAFNAELPIDTARLASAQPRISAAISQLAERESAPIIEDLLDRLEDDPGNTRLQNRLGATYARFGRYDDAEQIFQIILREGEHLPSLVNLGNIRLLQGHLDTALDFYRRAFFIEPENPTVLLNLVTLHTQSGDSSAARGMYDRLFEAAPQLAKEYAYLAPSDEGSARAGLAATVRVKWEDE